MNKEFLSEYNEEENWINESPPDAVPKKLICSKCGIELATLTYYSCNKEKCPIFKNPTY